MINVIIVLLMTREQAIRKREKLAAKLSSPSGVLRGSLLQRHDSSLLHGMSEMCSWRRRIRSGCSRWVIPAEKTRQVSVRPEQVPLVRKAIEEYRDVKQALEAISELNQFLLRLDQRGSQRTGTPEVVIAARRLQRNLPPMASSQETVEDLWEPWMRHADKALEDDTLLLVIQEELAKSAAGRARLVGARRRPLEVVLRMLLAEACTRDWSYEVLSREVRANLVYREFTRVGGEKVPDDRTMGNLARQAGAGGNRKTALPGSGDRTGKQDRSGL